MTLTGVWVHSACSLQPAARSSQLAACAVDDAPCNTVASDIGIGEEVVVAGCEAGGMAEWGGGCVGPWEVVSAWEADA
jgi:hypothetical protein